MMMVGWYQPIMLVTMLGMNAVIAQQKNSVKIKMKKYY